MINLLVVWLSERDALTKFYGGAFRQENISGLDVAMNECTAVKILKTMKHFVADGANFFLSQWLLVN